MRSASTADGSVMGRSGVGGGCGVGRREGRAKLSLPQTSWQLGPPRSVQIGRRHHPHAPALHSTPPDCQLYFYLVRAYIFSINCLTPSFSPSSATPYYLHNRQSPLQRAATQPTPQRSAKMALNLEKQLLFVCLCQFVITDTMLTM